MSPLLGCSGGCNITPLSFGQALISKVELRSGKLVMECVEDIEDSVTRTPTVKKGNHIMDMLYRDREMTLLHTPGITGDSLLALRPRTSACTGGGSLASL